MLGRHLMYVAYFSNRVSYMASQGILESHNQDVNSRVKNVHALFSEDNVNIIDDNMKGLGINYLYLLKNDPVQNRFINLSLKSNKVSIFYANENVAILGLSK